MKHGLTLLTILLASISESSGQKKQDLTGAWVLQKIVINGKRIDQTIGNTQFDTLFFSGKRFRQATHSILPDKQKIISTRTGTFEISEEKLEIKNLKSQSNQSTANLPDETVLFKMKKNKIVIERPIMIHTGKSETIGTSLHYYTKVK
jgi:hypothetical protein